MINDFELVEVFTFRKLVLAAHVHVVHQNIGIAVDQFEDSRSLDWLFCLLFVTRLFDPFIRCERRGRCKADTITIIFGFVEHVESAILVYDITIYAGFSILWSEQHFWLSFQIGKTFICIRIINNIWPVTMFHRPVHHIFPCGRIVYSLRGPNTFQILLSSILLLDIDDVGRPINQILGL